ncbi:cytochrome c oxidase subunit III [Fulvitalea axinellae]|uniref:Cytochrome c oxidase subunit III n=1 Tax=Fulvitalea axinellae TaxID=1182444 RepID=A0AAU9D9F0_9BACT|nr:cytochrome c oxidase subunit III [Fulvitalea axinellae]
MSSIKLYIKTWLALAAFVAPATVFAQDGLAHEDTLLIILGLTTMVSALILVAVFMVYRTVSMLLSKEEERLAVEKGVKYTPSPSFWEQFSKSMTDAVPVEREEEILLDHNYDGIKELDNHLPPWWTGLFYATIVFSGIYMAIYIVFDIKPTQEEEYLIEMKKGEEEVRLAALSLNEDNAEETSDPADLADGEKVYKANCVACHGALGEGKIGPNLTDKYWKHGSTFKDIFKTVKYGVPTKGMAAWQKKLSPVQIRNVSSFILTLQGTNPPNPKKPEGDLAK